MIEISSEGLVRFTFDFHTLDQVYLVGDFNQWNETSHPLNKVARTWLIDIQLPPGRYRFNYLAGEIYYSDLHAHRYERNSRGAEVSIIIVPLPSSENIDETS